MISSAFLDDVVTTLLNPKKFASFWKTRNQGFLLNPTLSGLKTGIKSIGTNAFSGSVLFGLPLAAAAMTTAGRGKALSTGASTWGSGILSAIPGAFFGGLPGALATSFLLQEPIAKAIAAPLQKIHDFGKWSASTTSHRNGYWQDSEAGYTMRQRAARELSGSLLNARQVLGKEAAFLHE